ERKPSRPRQRRAGGGGADVVGGRRRASPARRDQYRRSGGGSRRAAPHSRGVARARTVGRGHPYRLGNAGRTRMDRESRPTRRQAHSFAMQGYAGVGRLGGRNVRPRAGGGGSEAKRRRK